MGQALEWTVHHVVECECTHVVGDSIVQLKCYGCEGIPPIAITTVTHSSVIHRVFWCTLDSHLGHTVVPLIIDFTVCHDIATITQLLVAMCTVAMCTHVYVYLCICRYRGYTTCTFIIIFSFAIIPHTARWLPQLALDRPLEFHNLAASWVKHRSISCLKHTFPV